MIAPIETIPNPHRIKVNRKKYICCQCDNCNAIHLLTHDFPDYYYCPSCNKGLYPPNHIISSVRYKFLRAYYDFKAKLIKLTSRS